MVSLKQWQRAQRYIQIGIEEGAHLLVGGPGLPDGIDAGWLIRPTVFSCVANQLTIAREEIFGPVLSIIPYDDQDEALTIANDRPTVSRLTFCPQPCKEASRIDAVRVLIDTRGPRAASALRRLQTIRYRP
ncbi:aldehyde dehydrogenase family protein [Pseudomonas sp. N2-5-1-1]|uniref:aldehyde dehydrogenase family protein n=1 Tax=unclassified Pseudomonas TaxID=196821 RepID=UPI0034E0CE20